MTTVENTIDHDYLNHLVETHGFGFSLWTGTQMNETPRFYFRVNIFISDTEAVIRKLFRLTPTHFRGESITPEQYAEMNSKKLVPTKLWVSEGQVHTDEFGSLLSEADKQVFLAAFFSWASADDLNNLYPYDHRAQMTVLEQRATILNNFRAEYGLEGFPDSYIIKMLTSLTPTSGK